MAIKFLDLTGLQQVWNAILAKENALIASIDEVKSSVGEIQSSIEGLEIDLDSKVDAEDGKSLVADEEIAKLATVAEGAQVNIIETIKVNDVSQSVTDKTVNISIPVVGIEDTDKILSLDNGKIGTTLAYVREDHNGVDSLVLKGKDGEVIGAIPVADFVMDGVLKDISFAKDAETGEDTNILNFTFATYEINEETGEKTLIEKTLPVDLSKYIDVYEAGEGISINNNKIDVKVAKVNNFLTINESNELVVDDMTVDKTKTKDSITIAGGPLAEAGKVAFPDGVIPANMDLQSLLNALFCKEEYPTPTSNTPSYSVTISNPSITAKNSAGTAISSGALVEVGSPITFNAVSAKSANVSKTNPEVSGFTYGYWVWNEETSDWEVNQNNSISSDWNVSVVENEMYSLTPSITKFSGTLPEKSEDTEVSNVSLDSCTLTATIGTNKYTVVETAPKHTGYHDGIESKYVVSNLGNRSDSEMSTAIDSISNVEVTPANSSAEFSVIGVYPVYNNSNGTNLNKSTLTKMNLSQSSSFEISFGMESDGTTTNFHSFAFPASHTLSKVEIYNTMSKAYETYSGGSENISTTYDIQGVETAYTIWKRKGNAYSETTKFKFTLNKALNS